MSHLEKYFHLWNVTCLHEKAVWVALLNCHDFSTDINAKQMVVRCTPVHVRQNLISCTFTKNSIFENPTILRLCGAVWRRPISIFCVFFRDYCWNSSFFSFVSVIKFVCQSQIRCVWMTYSKIATDIIVEWSDFEKRCIFGEFEIHTF